MKKDAAEALGVTKMSISRASEQLLSLGLIVEESHGKECYMRIEGRPIELFNKAKDHMINPIQKTVYVADNDSYRKLLLSGESALSKHSELNSPVISAKAIYKNKLAKDSVKEIDVKWETEKEPVCLELWKYDPEIFSNDGSVDPISLALCYQNNVDERIEEAIDEYLEECL